jgi:hypothetical protein
LQQESKLPKVKLPRQSALTLVAINVLFLICNFPRLFLNIAEWNIQLGSVIYADECKQVPNWFDFLMSLSNFSLTINRAANCLIYFYFSKKFIYELQMNIQWAKAWAWGFIITSSSHVWSVLTYCHSPTSTKNEVGVKRQLMCNPPPTTTTTTTTNF